MCELKSWKKHARKSKPLVRSRGGPQRHVPWINEVGCKEEWLRFDCKRSRWSSGSTLICFYRMKSQLREAPLKWILPQQIRDLTTKTERQGFDICHYPEVQLEINTALVKLTALFSVCVTCTVKK